MATTAVGVEPLRESAQRVLIEAHLAGGNFVEARRMYMAYHEMLGAELGLSPSVELAEIVSCHRKMGAPSLDRLRSVEIVGGEESEVGGGAGQVLTARATRRR